MPRFLYYLSVYENLSKNSIPNRLARGFPRLADAKVHTFYKTTKLFRRKITFLAYFFKAIDKNQYP